MYKFILLITFVLVFFAIAKIFNLKLSDLEKTIDKKLNKEKTIKQLTAKKENFILRAIKQFNGMLKATGQSEKITTTIILSIVLAGVGVFVGIMFGNPYMVPVTAIAIGIIPFVRIQSLYAEYRTQILSELSTALPIINASYIRTSNIDEAISENLDMIDMPLKAHFEEFLTTTRYVNPNVKEALKTLSMRVDNSTFRKWCEIMQSCVDDASQKAALPAVCDELNKVHYVIGDLRNILFKTKKTFFSLIVAAAVLLVVLIYVLPSTFMLDTNTPLQQFLLALNLLAMLLTSIRCIYLTRQTNFDM